MSITHIVRNELMILRFAAEGSKVVKVGRAQAWHIFGLGQDWREREGAWIGRENPRNVVFGFRARRLASATA